jgi:hypothetical protein
MTALGKTLVFFVLLFSVITGGMMAMAYATRTNWKAGYDNAQAELKVLGDAQKAERQLFVQRKEEFEKKIDSLNKAIEVDNTKRLGLDAEIAAEKKKNSELNKKALSEEANNRAATNQIEALSNERDQMKAQIAQRNTLLLKLETDISKATDDKTQSDILANRLKEEREKLMIQVEKKSAQLREFAERGLVPNAGNPKVPVEVSGQVNGVDGSIAQTSLGKDHGVNVGDELKVYRLNPAPLYLGTLRITIAREHDSVGTFTPAGRNLMIKTGDTVDTKVVRGIAN